MSRWHVTIRAHKVGRHDVPAREIVASGETKGHGLLQALRWAHADAGVPPLKSFIKASAPHCTVVQHADSEDDRKRKMRGKR